MTNVVLGVIKSTSIILQQRSTYSLNKQQVKTLSFAWLFPPNNHIQTIYLSSFGKAMTNWLFPAIINQHILHRFVYDDTQMSINCSTNIFLPKMFISTDGLNIENELKQH